MVQDRQLNKLKFAVSTVTRRQNGYPGSSAGSQPHAGIPTMYISRSTTVEDKVLLVTQYYGLSVFSLENTKAEVVLISCSLVGIDQLHTVASKHLYIIKATTSKEICIET